MKPVCLKALVPYPQFRSEKSKKDYSHSHERGNPERGKRTTRDHGLSAFAARTPPYLGLWTKYTVLMVLCGYTGLAFAQETEPTEPFPSAEEQAQSFVLPKDFEIELIAAEPDLINPLGIAVDEQGRIYVSESHTYRYEQEGSPVAPSSNPIVRLDPAPDGTGYQRVRVAENFDDPVMSLLVRDGQLWCTNNDRLLRFDIGEDGKATNRQTLLLDKNKAWNPFGMYTIEWGYDGLLYLSVSNHDIDISGPTNSVSGRGSSGIVVRMQPDGRAIERLVHGIRAPYPHELDPFGQLWVISNGEGNPNRFIRAIEGVDYHCYSRPAVDNDWLRGEHPLAPPCFELPRGSSTQLLRYYGANFPSSYRGSVIIPNWGAHGFASPNHDITRFVFDELGEVTSEEIFLTSGDPHFRPSQMIMAPDGGLLILDWSGRDDESNLRGRIWKVHYTGDDKPIRQTPLDPALWDVPYALDALASPDHLIREAVIQWLAEQGNDIVAELGKHAATGTPPLGAANALWALFRIGTEAAYQRIAQGTHHADARVRRMALRLLRRGTHDTAPSIAKMVLDDPDLQVRLAAALALEAPDEIRAAHLSTLQAGSANDRHLRYEAAWHIAKHADESTVLELLYASQPNLRRAGLIAVDVALYEDFGTRPVAEAVLAKVIADPGPLELSVLLTLARINQIDALPALKGLLKDSGASPAIATQAIQVLLETPDAAAQAVAVSSRTRLLGEIRDRTVAIATNADVLAYLYLLASDQLTEVDEGPLKEWIVHPERAIRERTHAYLRENPPPSDRLASVMWHQLLDVGSKLDVEGKIMIVATLMAIEEAPVVKNWEMLLAAAEPMLLLDIIRSWRQYAEHPAMTQLLTNQAPAIVDRVPACKEDLSEVLGWLAMVRGEADTALDAPPIAKDALARALEAADIEGASPLLGYRVFERVDCIKCHLASTYSSLLGPSLEGIGKDRDTAYLVETVLFPSEVIKTGYETELIEMVDGDILSGRVQDEGDNLRIITQERETIVAKSDVENREQQNLSLMPEGLEEGLSRGELIDLIAYLASLQ